MKLFGTFLTLCGLLAAQTVQAPNPVQQHAGNTAGPMPIYRVTVVARTMKAINYNHRSGSTKIDFRGTALLPAARGEATVESKQGVIKISARMEKLQPATKYGPEYLTYVMWAITPEGRATNVGEVLLNGDNSKLDATTELQSFGLIITAEPYFAVTQPSDVVVMENFVRKDTVGTIEQVDAKFELLQRGQYVMNVNPADVKAPKLNPKVPLELYEARNAVQIAGWTGASTYAADTFKKALDGLKNAEGYLVGKAGKRPIGTVAREAVQMAEDARIITIKKMGEATLASERQAAADREAKSESERAAAQADAMRISQNAETARLAALQESERVRLENAAKMAATQRDAEQAKREAAILVAAAQNEAERVRLENAAKMAAAQNDADKAKLEAANQLAAARDEAERLKRQNDAKAAALQMDADAQKLAAQNEADRVKRESDAQKLAAQNEADRLKRESDAQLANAQLALDQAGKDKAKAEAEKVALRAQLLQQFNAVLQTRDTARGLIVNMSDVLFDTAKFTLRPAAREKLAKIAGIISGHPGLTLAVEGHTDSVGADDYNQRLSEQRGSAVRDYLTQAGMANSSVSSKGFGKTMPVATNDTAAGRQQNRRVEIVVAGDIIGSTTEPVVIR